MGKGEVSSAAKADGFDLEARWRGELSAQERAQIKAWAKKAQSIGRCEMKIGKQRSRIAVTFDRKKIEESSRAQIGQVEAMMASQGVDDGGEGAMALAGLRTAEVGSARGLLVRDYGEVLAKDWAIQSSASLQALLPSRCGLRVGLGRALGAEGSGDGG